MAKIGVGSSSVYFSRTDIPSSQYSQEKSVLGEEKVVIFRTDVPSSHYTGERRSPDYHLWRRPLTGLSSD